MTRCHKLTWLRLNLISVLECVHVECHYFINIAELYKQFAKKLGYDKDDSGSSNRELTNDDFSC